MSCNTLGYNYAFATNQGQYADANRYLLQMCQQSCPLPAGASCPVPSSSSNGPGPVISPIYKKPTVINQWFNTGSSLPDDCASLQAIYSKAADAGDYATAMEAAAKLTIANCSVPNEYIDPSGFNCDDAYRIYYNKLGMFDEDARAKAYASLVANNCPQVTSGTGPTRFDCASTQKQYLDALTNGQPTADLYHQLVIHGCTVPPNPVQPNPVPKPETCSDYMNDYTTAVTNKDAVAMQNALRNMCLQQCKLPPGYVCDNEGPGPIIGPGGTGGSTPSGGGDIGQPPPVNPCTGSDSLTLADYLVEMPLKGIKDDALLAVGLGAAGGIGGAVLAVVFVPEGGKWVRIPATVGGAYGGLIVNGILDNYDFIKNAEKYGIVFGSLVTSLGAVHGLYQSIHQHTETFLKTELGGVMGEVTYKVGEFFFAGGPIGFISDIVWGDRTWTKQGYDKAKCEANCGDPKLSSVERKLCKLGARLDLKF